MRSIHLLSSLFAIGAASYAPEFSTSCDSVHIRLTGTPQQGNQSLSSEETAYIAGRKVQALESLKSYLGPVAGAVYGASLDTFNVTTMPVLGVAVSGGGERAALYGAGALAAFNGVTPNTTGGGVGGVLPSATYISALSGGSWLLSSLVLNNFPASLYDLVLGNTTSNQTGWNLDINVLAPGNASQTAVVFEQILSDLALKKAAGPFNVTYGDFWARSLSRHFVPGTTVANFYDNTTSDHGASLLLSSATYLSSWTSHAMPFPLIVATVFSVNTKEAPLSGDTIPLQNVVYEFSPLEFGSYDPELAAFLPLTALGTELDAGTPVGGCATGFDNAGFILGISSNLWIAYNLTNDTTWTSSASPVNIAWEAINSTFYSVQPEQELDISAVPNPFKGLNPSTYEDSNQDQLRLLDGGLDGEVDPLAPLLVPARNIDTIIVLDATADSAENKPTGASMVATFDRQSVLPNGTLELPPLPSSTTIFISQGLNVRPVFFGCGGTPANVSGKTSESPYPLLVYLPNNDPSGVTNQSTATLNYTVSETIAFLDATVAITERGLPGTNGSADPLWPTCLACAVVERARGRTATDRTLACENCFTRYCWSGNQTAANGTGTAGGNSTSGGGSGTDGKSSGESIKVGKGAVAAIVVAVGLGILA